MCNAAVYTVRSRLLESDYLGKAKTGGLVYVSLLQGVNVGWKAYENAFKLGSDKTLLRVSEGKLLERPLGSSSAFPMDKGTHYNFILLLNPC